MPTPDYYALLDGRKDVRIVELLAEGTRLLEANRSALLQLERRVRQSARVRGVQDQLRTALIAHLERIEVGAYLLSRDLPGLLHLLKDFEESLRRSGIADPAEQALIVFESFPVRELSDGFQSILALALDMMLSLSRTSRDMRNIEGLVLIDEIDVHLHPIWKLRVVRDLRRLFRRTRFIVTTHDPLCVQGLAPGELHVMTRHPHSRRIHVHQNDVPPGLRADQILTGEWFGLGSTRDPDTLKLMQRHSELLVASSTDSKEVAERTRIERTLRERIGHFADSPYERAAMLAYAEFAPRITVLPTAEQQRQIQARIRALLPDA